MTTSHPEPNSEPNSEPDRIGGVRIATDVGGTFTDLVSFNLDPETGVEIQMAKTATTPPEFDQGVVDVIEQSGIDPAQVAMHVHGTTMVINALTERKGAKVGLIASAGFRDTLEIARGNRPDFFNLDYVKPAPFVPRYLRREVAGRLTYTGAERQALDLSALPGIVDDFQANGVEAVALSLIHSWVNPDHELRVRDELQRLWPGVPIVVSSDITREWREYERASTAVLSAFVQPVAERYLRQLDTRLTQAGMPNETLVMQSNGGVSSIAAMASTPIAMIESGPASGMYGAAKVGRLIGEPNVLALDIGGTTAKCSLIQDGDVRVMTDYWIGRSNSSAGYPAMIPVVDLVEIGNGGGSIANIDESGKLRVGPQSAGAVPGPAAYGNGGTDATTTDANLWLGRISAEDFCGGTIQADMEATEQALGAIGRTLTTGDANPAAAARGIADAAARGILRIANNNMINALKMVSINRGHDPRDFTMVAFGGGGPMHAVALAKELQVRRVVVPAAASVFSAWGMIMSDLRRDLFATALYDLEETSVDAIATALNELQQRASTAIRSDIGPEITPTFQWFGNLRYQGQEHATEVAIEPEDLNPNGLGALQDRFRNQFEAEYTYRLELPIEIVGLHLVATAPSGSTLPEPSPLGDPDSTSAKTGSRHVDFAEDGAHETDIFALDLLIPGMRFAGPAIAEGAGTTVVVNPGASVTVDGFNNLIIDVPA